MASLALTKMRRFNLTWILVASAFCFGGLLLPHAVHAAESNYCAVHSATGKRTPFGEQLIKQNLFPLIPTIIIDYKSAEGGCIPSYWNRDVIAVLVYKALALLNYIAGAAAVLATIYGGVMYLGGFASKSAAETAKKILIGTYTGLIIVILARFIVQGSFSLFGNGALEVNTVLDPLPDVPDQQP